MDNVAYYKRKKSEKTRNILAKNGINLKFQPSYSPNLNPIKPSWRHTKDDIRNAANLTKKIKFLSIKLLRFLIKSTSKIAFE